MAAEDSAADSSRSAVVGTHEAGAGELKEDTDHCQEARGARRLVGMAGHCPETGGVEIPRASRWGLVQPLRSCLADLSSDRMTTGMKGREISQWARFQDCLQLIK